MDYNEIEIVDAQVHANQLCPEWRTADNERIIDSALAAMNAVGVSAIFVDEYLGLDEMGRHLPGHVGPNGCWRADESFAPAAVAREPHRFGFLTYIDHRDPDLEVLVRRARAQSGCLALRVLWLGPDPVWRDDPFEEGGFDRLFSCAEAVGMPVFLMAPGRAAELEPFLERHTELQVIFDHCGVRLPRSLLPIEDRYSRFDPVLSLARFPNLALKWAHVESWSADPYPFPDMAVQLRRAVDAFGPNRIMWASDCTQLLPGGDLNQIDGMALPRPWSELLYYLRDSEAFSVEEKQWLLGRTVRTILDWNA